MFRKKKTLTNHAVKTAKLKHGKQSGQWTQEPPKPVLTPLNVGKNDGNKVDNITSFFEDEKGTNCFNPTAPYPIPTQYMALPKPHKGFAISKNKERETEETPLEAKGAEIQVQGFHLIRTPSEDEAVQHEISDHKPSHTEGALVLVTTPDRSKQTSSAPKDETLSSLLLQSLRCYTVDLPMQDDIGTVVLQHTSSMNTVFKGYRRNAEGIKGFAETHKLFRASGDQIVTIDGSHCVHVPFEDVLRLLQQATTPEQTHKRILLCSFSSKKKAKIQIS